MNFESQQSEAFPTREQVLEVVTRHAGNLGLDFKRELSDDSGIYFIEIMTTEPDSEGYIREYTYSRKSPKTGESLPPKIYVAFFEGDLPVTGEDVASF